MTITLGRASVNEDPWSGLRVAGRRVTFESDINATSVNEFKARLAQLSGLVDNPDEQIVPFTWSEDSTFDGFYRVRKVEARWEATTLTTGVCPIEVEIERIDGYAAPQFEAVASVVDMTNAHGLPTASPVARVALPNTDLREASIPRTTAGSTSGAFNLGTSRTTDDGTVIDASISHNATVLWQWATPAAYYYVGSARFEQAYGGTYYPLHGRQAVNPGASSPWRISNGLVRATVNYDTGSVSVAHYDGSQWDTAKTFWIGGATTAMTVSSAPIVRVMRNTPEQVSVRLIVKTSAGSQQNTLDLSLRRGCRWVSFLLNSSNQNDWYIERTTVEAGTALTGGFRATSTDADGNRYILASPLAQTNNLPNGRLKTTTTTLTQFPFMVGSEVGADGSGQSAINEYAAAVSEFHRVVVR